MFFLASADWPSSHPITGNAAREAGYGPYATRPGWPGRGPVIGELRPLLAWEWGPCNLPHGIGRATFNRPQARNAFTFEMYEQLAQICERANRFD